MGHNILTDPYVCNTIIQKCRVIPKVQFQTPYIQNIVGIFTFALISKKTIQFKSEKKESTFYYEQKKNIFQK